MPKRYPEEFRRKVLDLVAAGRPVAQVAADLGISDQTIHQAQVRPDRRRPDARRAVRAVGRTQEGTGPRERGRDPERARELLHEPHDPEGATRP